MVVPAQGHIWWAEAADQRRPVLVVTRTEAIPVLRWLIVAPVTRTVRNIPTEVPLDEEQGLPQAGVASFDNLQPIRRSFLTDYVGRLRDPRRDVYRALGAMADC